MADTGSIPVNDFPFPWNGRGAFFERASGLVFVNTTVTQWQVLAREAAEGRAGKATKSIVDRLVHELYHYLQFFGCGYMTNVCADHYQVIKKNSPFPFTQESYAAFFGRSAVQPDGLRAINRALRQVGASEVSALQIIEGCAFLYQYLATAPEPLHGEYLGYLRQSADEDLYGRFYHKAALRLKDRAVGEALFVGTCALEFAEPESVIDEILALNAALDPLRPDDDVTKRREQVIMNVDPRRPYLGTAYALAAAGAVYHPLLTKSWIFDRADGWEAAIGTALAGRRPNTTADCLRHVPVVIQGAAYYPPNPWGELADQAEIMAWIDLGRVSLHLGSGATWDVHVQSRSADSADGAAAT